MKLTTVLVAILAACSTSIGQAVSARRATKIERLPERVLATMEMRDRWFTRAATRPTSETRPTAAFVVQDLSRWRPGQSVRIAFLGGTKALHKDIADATLQITESCNLKLDFGVDAATGNHRTWTTNDADYVAEIRISFDEMGYFSLVGTDAVSPIIGVEGDTVGGRPNQRTMNFDGFHIQRPLNWKQVVRHEFLHALAFQHEHQSPFGPCADEFRWQDDEGYQPTLEDGEFVTDSQGRRPGIYTYLSGAPNFWSRATVDHNLRPASPANVSVGDFDRESVMLYRFPALFYRSSPSPCAPSTDGESLSEGDKRGLQKLYPFEVMAAERVATQQQTAQRALLEARDIRPDVKATLRKRWESR